MQCTENPSDYDDQGTLLVASGKIEEVRPGVDDEHLEEACTFTYCFSDCRSVNFSHNCHRFMKFGF